MAKGNRAADIMKQFQEMNTDEKNDDLEFLFGPDSAENNKQLEGLKSTQKNISPELLHPHPDNSFSTKDDSEFESLKHAIKEYGITNPIVCYESDDGYTILSGHRRTKAAKELGLEKVPVRIINNPQQLGWSKFDELVFLGSENLSSRQQKPIDIARFAANLLEVLDAQEKETGIKIAGRKRDYIAERIPNLKGRMITAYLKLLELPKDFQEWTGELINLKTALKLADISNSGMFDNEFFLLANEIKSINNDKKISEEEKKKKIESKIAKLEKDFELACKKPKPRQAERKANVKSEIKKMHNGIKKIKEGEYIIPKKITEQKAVLQEIEDIRKALDVIEKEIHMTTPV